MNAKIANLDDATAVRVLRTWAHHQANAHDAGADPSPAWTPELAQALHEAPPETADTTTPPTDVEPTEGDLARAALQVLAADSVHGPGIAFLLKGDTPRESFSIDPQSTIALITASTLAVKVLLTSLKVKRTSTGKWTIDLNSNAASTDLITSLFGLLLRKPPTEENQDKSKDAEDEAKPEE